MGLSIYYCNSEGNQDLESKPSKSAFSVLEKILVEGIVMSQILRGLIAQ